MWHRTTAWGATRCATNGFAWTPPTQMSRRSVRAVAARRGVEANGYADRSANASGSRRVGSSPKERPKPPDFVASHEGAIVIPPHGSAFRPNGAHPPWSVRAKAGAVWF